MAFFLLYRTTYNAFTYFKEISHGFSRGFSISYSITHRFINLYNRIFYSSLEPLGVQQE